MTNSLLRLAFVGTLLGPSACAQPEQITQVSFELEDGLVIDTEVCNFIDVTYWYEDKLNEYERLPCDATGVSLHWTEAPTLIQVRYWYTEIPFGCDDMSCWHDATMASGETEFDPNVEEIRVEIERTIGSPF